MNISLYLIIELHDAKYKRETDPIFSLSLSRQSVFYYQSFQPQLPLSCLGPDHKNILFSMFQWLNLGTVNVCSCRSGEMQSLWFRHRLGHQTVEKIFWYFGIMIFSREIGWSISCVLSVQRWLNSSLTKPWPDLKLRFHVCVFAIWLIVIITNDDIWLCGC